MNKNLLRVLSVFACFNLLTFAAITAFAAPGDGDATFGNGGRVITHVGDRYTGGAKSIAVQSDGKIVATGDALNFFLVRYNLNGSLDSSFGSNGKVNNPFLRNGDTHSNAVAVQSDDKILLAGSNTVNGKSNFAIARYNSDGTFDSSFGSQGKFTLAVSPSGSNNQPADILYCIVVQKDGKIVAAGKKGSSSVVVIRLDANGTLDASFAVNGVYTGNQYSFGNQSFPTRQLVVRPDGKILVGGNSNYNGMITGTIIRLNTNGTLDAGFGSGGTLRIDDNLQRFAISSIAIQSNGRIIAAGTIFKFSSAPFRSPLPNFYNGEITLLGYNPNGSIDTTFGNKGITTILTKKFGEELNAMVVQADDKIVVCGFVTSLIKARYSPFVQWDRDFLVARFNAGGLPDPSFGGVSGTVYTDSGSHLSDMAHDVVIQPDGDIVVAGKNEIDSSPFVITRYLSR